MMARDRVRIVRGVNESDGAGGFSPSNETELLNSLAEVKEIRAPQRLDLLQQNLNRVIQVKFYRRKDMVPLQEGDVLYWKEEAWKLQGADIAENSNNIVRVVMASK